MFICQEADFWLSKLSKNGGCRSTAILYAETFRESLASIFQWNTIFIMEGKIIFGMFFGWKTSSTSLKQAKAERVDPNSVITSFTLHNINKRITIIIMMLFPPASARELKTIVMWLLSATQ